MKAFLKIIFFTTTLALLFLGCDESEVLFNEKEGGTILPGKIDTTIVVDTIITTTIIETKDTLVLRDSVYVLDTIQIVKIDSSIIVDTITTVNYDTLHTVDTIFINDGSSVDTLYILDTTKHVVDTIHITQPIKMVFFVSLDLNYDTSDVKIICRNFSGGIPTMLNSKEQFELNEAGEAVFTTALDSLQLTVPYEYTIVVKDDTLRGVIDTPSNYYLKSLTVNDSTYCYDDVKEENGFDLWEIPLDFSTSEPLTISWDADENSSFVRTFSGSTSKYPWLRGWWGYTSDISFETTESQVVFPLNDPLTAEISGSIRLELPRDSADIAPDAESLRMEAYHFINYPRLSFSIKRPVESINGIRHLYSIHMTPDQQNSADVHLYRRDTITDVDVVKASSKFGAFHGSFGNYRVKSSLGKMRYAFIRYSVSDPSDSLLLGLTSGMRDTSDLSSWSGFSAVLRAGAEAPGDTVVELVALSDFAVSELSSLYPGGTTLADPETAEHLRKCDGYMITQQGSDPADTSFYLWIDELFFVGESGLKRDILSGIE